MARSLTQTERLVLVEQKLTTIETKVDQNHDESKQFHTEVLVKIDSLLADRIELATLREKVKTLEKLTWLAITAAAGAMIKASIDLLINR